MIFASVNSMYEANLFLTNLFDFLAFEPDIRPDPGRRAVPRPIKDGIELRDVNFAYPGVREPVLRGINLKVNSGETIASGRRQRRGQDHHRQAADPAVRPIRRPAF